MSWEAYINGNIMSNTSLRYIQNLLAATAATRMDDPNNSSDDTDAEEWENVDRKVGGMDLVEKTLKGMCKEHPDEGVERYVQN